MPTKNKDEMRDFAIYKLYLESRINDTSIQNIANMYGITRQAVYDAIKRVRRGNVAKIRSELIKARNEILWKYQFQPMFELFPKLKRGMTNPDMRPLIVSMHKAGFPKTLIAQKLDMQRSSVDYHLNQK
jgi:predicted DNA-binding protein YlxM (UPF0122 family)